MILINLFSVFDPISYYRISLNWLILLLILLYFGCSYYVIYRGLNLFKKEFYLNINLIFKEIREKNYLGISLVRLVAFIYLISSNLIGLFPFIFTGTAHIYFTLGVGLVMWIRFFLIGWVKNFVNSAAHLVPEGSPLLLSPLLVLIESIRHLIRPFTLSIRLAANIIAGHLIIGLLSRIRNFRIFRIMLSVFLQRIILLLEFGVAIIQGFVFSVLLLLYSLEYY